MSKSAWPVSIASILVAAGAAASTGPAPVVIVEFSDFQCPYCAETATVLAGLRRNYPHEVEVVFKHFPLPMHGNARLAAEAALAAGEQGKFWEMHDRLFALGPRIDREGILAAAEVIGLDVRQFVASLDSRRNAARVEMDMAEARALGVRGTPTLFIGGKPYDGPRSLPALGHAVEAALGRSNAPAAPARILGDADGDGVPDGSDCRPHDGTVWAAPSEARDLVVSANDFAWTVPAAAGGTLPVLYDLIRSDVASDFSAATCVASNVTATVAADPAVPGGVWFYLVRSKNACGGSLGSDSAGAPRAGAECLRTNGAPCTYPGECAGAGCCAGACQDVLSDPNSCGGCGLVCSGNNIGVRTCSAGVCDGSCDPGFMDCNGDKLVDGCEADTLNDRNNCGGCGTACPAGQGCIGGSCLVCSPATCIGGCCVGTQCVPGIDCATCRPYLGSCVVGTDCCSGNCEAGKCQVPAGSCRLNAATCASDADCCSGRCDVNVDGVTRCSAPNQCRRVGETCTAASQCCSLACNGSTCIDAPPCRTVGQSCSQNAVCCSGTCSGGLCTGSAGCGVLGELCAGGSQCCSGVCQAGHCTFHNHCRADGDACTAGADCCSGVCEPSTRRCATAGGCALSEDPCSGLRACCGLDCAATDGLGFYCYPIGGCRVAGELCQAHKDCCSLSCAPPDPQGLRRCENPPGCIYPGEVCGGAYQNCCVGGAADCRPTGMGITRCWPGGACLPDGLACHIRDECCSGYCLRDDASATGYLCAPGCLAAGQVGCTTNADCCAGSLCQRGTCQSGGPSCAHLGASCANTADCCTGSCVGGFCQ